MKRNKGEKAKLQFKPQSYHYIWAWSKIMGSYDYYIGIEQQQASESGAPLDAIYRKHTFDKDAPPEWVRFCELKDDNPIKQQVLQLVQSRES